MKCSWPKFLLCAVLTIGTLAACEQDGPAAGTSPTVTPISDSHCLAGITNYGSAGKFSVSAKTYNTYVKAWIPAVPSGCKVPVIHFANGTTATCSMYAEAIERLASHGFLMVCYENTDTGAGDYGITSIQTAFDKHGSMLEKRIGSTGHSQGGQASLVTLQKAEVKWGSGALALAGLAIEPASGYGTQPSGGSWQSYYKVIQSPVFMFSGNSSTGFANSSLLGMTTGDGLVGISWVQEGFDALNPSIEAYHWTRSGATHIPVPNGPTQEVSVAWFRWKLLGDKKACQAFKNLKSAGWSQKDVQNEKSCN